MSDAPDSLILNMLRTIRGDIAEVKADIAEGKERLGILEAQYGSLSRPIDRIGGDMERIKRRLDLADA